MEPIKEGSTSVVDPIRSKQELEVAENLLLLLLPKKKDSKTSQCERTLSTLAVDEPNSSKPHLQPKRTENLLDTLADLACREVETGTLKRENDASPSSSPDRAAPAKRWRSMSEGGYQRLDTLNQYPYAESWPPHFQYQHPYRRTPPLFSCRRAAIPISPQQPFPVADRPSWYPPPLHRRSQPPSLASHFSGFSGWKKEDKSYPKETPKKKYSHPMDLMPSLGFDVAPAKETGQHSLPRLSNVKRARPVPFNHCVQGKSSSDPIQVVSSPTSPGDRKILGGDNEGERISLMRIRRDSMDSVGSSAAEIVAEYQLLEKQEGPLPLPHAFPRLSHIYNQNGRIGIYTPAERAAILERFRQKRERRIWKKKIRYNCRKNLADKRHRVKGRFVRSTMPGEVNGVHRTPGEGFLYQNDVSSSGSNIAIGSSDADSSDASATSSPPPSDEEPVRVRRHSIAF